MPRRKKKAREMTTDELARSVFPRKAVSQIKKMGQEQDGKAGKKSSRK